MLPFMFHYPAFGSGWRGLPVKICCLVLSSVVSGKFLLPGTSCLSKTVRKLLFSVKTLLPSASFEGGHAAPALSPPQGDALRLGALASGDAGTLCVRTPTSGTREIGVIGYYHRFFETGVPGHQARDNRSSNVAAESPTAARRRCGRAQEYPPRQMLLDKPAAHPPSQERD